MGHSCRKSAFHPAKTAYTEVIVFEFMYSFDGYIFDLDRSISEIQMYYL